MKKLLLLALSACFFTAIAVAQETKDTKQVDPKEWDNKVKTELKLTQDQIVKYDAVGKEYGDKMEALKKETANLTPEVQKERKMALKKEKQGKLFEFFTPKQQTKYTEMVEEKKKATKPAGQ